MNRNSSVMTDHEQRILENLNTATLLSDSKLRLSYMNPAAEMLFAVSLRHMVGHSLFDLIKCPGKTGESHLTRAINSGHTFTERELTLRIAGGREVTVDCTVIPLQDGASIDGLLIEIQRIDRQLRISREEHILSQQQSARDLVRGMAHEIKNPLGGIRGAAQLLERELHEPELMEYTQVIIDEADRLQNLVNQMLGSNKLPHPEEHNIHTLLERVRHLVLAEWGEFISIDRDYDPSLPNIVVDRDRVIQALLNIVRNAARAVKPVDGGRIILRTRIKRRMTIGNHNHRLVIQIGIEDNGPGIPEAIREKLFYPMVTASEGGMGLGLSIAQSLINQHQGLVECDSRPGKTLFNVLLPVEN
ncbi:MAG: nitrogen regulation protein NR(II) [Gammaproteobacteria bacterium]|nr:nitrogen regulation protein NR(II) [Gammaproteobacteria bacterium]